MVHTKIEELNIRELHEELKKRIEPDKLDKLNTSGNNIIATGEIMFLAIHPPWNVKGVAWACAHLYSLDDSKSSEIVAILLSEEIEGEINAIAIVEYMQKLEDAGVRIDKGI